MHRKIIDIGNNKKIKILKIFKIATISLFSTIILTCGKVENKKNGKINDTHSIELSFNDTKPVSILGKNILFRDKNQFYLFKYKDSFDKWMKSGEKGKWDQYDFYDYFVGSSNGKFIRLNTIQNTCNKMLYLLKKQIGKIPTFYLYRMYFDLKRKIAKNNPDPLYKQYKNERKIYKNILLTGRYTIISQKTLQILDNICKKRQQIIGNKKIIKDNKELTTYRDTGIDYPPGNYSIGTLKTYGEKAVISELYHETLGHGTECSLSKNYWGKMKIIYKKLLKKSIKFINKNYKGTKRVYEWDDNKFFIVKENSLMRIFSEYSYLEKDMVFPGFDMIGHPHDSPNELRASAIAVLMSYKVRFLRLYSRLSAEDKYLAKQLIKLTLSSIYEDDNLLQINPITNNRIKNLFLSSNTISIDTIPSENIYTLKKYIPKKIKYNNDTYDINFDYVENSLLFLKFIKPQTEFSAINLGLYLAWLSENNINKDSHISITSGMNINIEDYCSFLNDVMDGKMTINGKKYIFAEEGYLRNPKNSCYFTARGIIKINIREVLKTGKYLVKNNYLKYQNNTFSLAGNCSKNAMFIFLSTSVSKESVDELIRHELMHCYFDNDQNFRHWLWNTIISKLSAEQKNAIIFYMLENKSDSFQNKNCSPSMIIDELFAYFSHNFYIKNRIDNDLVRNMQKDYKYVDIKQQLNFIFSEYKKKRKYSKSSEILFSKNNFFRRYFKRTIEYRNYYFNKKVVLDNLNRPK